MAMTRRELLSASAAIAVVPALGGRAFCAPLSREADIVVIGAGAAGIAAARRIQAASRKVIVVEAASQIGGRCLTDTATFDVPLDRGARWMHNPDTNPMIRLARSSGLDVYPAPLGQKIRIGQRFARAAETEQFLATLVRANRAIDEASRGKVDVACASALPKDLADWAGTMEFVLGANAVGKETPGSRSLRCRSNRANSFPRCSRIGAKRVAGSTVTRSLPPLASRTMTSPRSMIRSLTRSRCASISRSPLP